MSGPSLDDLRLIARATGTELPLALLEYRYGAVDHARLASLVDRAIDECAMELARFPKEHFALSEDQLTIILILQLKGKGFMADHDSTSGGHCDIVITDRDGFLWLGEAKKVSGKQNATILAGYNQLMDRYSTGLAAQDRGCLIVYCNTPRVDEVLAAWHDHLPTKVAATLGPIDGTKIEFESVQIHQRTGRPYVVRHKPISIYFAPLAAKLSGSV